MELVKVLSTQEMLELFLSLIVFLSKILPLKFYENCLLLASLLKLLEILN